MLDKTNVSYFLRECQFTFCSLRLQNCEQCIFYNQLGKVFEVFLVKFRKGESGKLLKHSCHFADFNCFSTAMFFVCGIALQSLFVGQLDYTGYLNLHLGVPGQMALYGRKGGDRSPLMVDHQIALNQRNFTLMG